jgi:hypothetical protein
MNPVFKAFDAEKISPNLQNCLYNEMRVEEVQLAIKKREPFIFLTDCNMPTMSVINSNNCCKYVEDQKVSMYYCNYSTKHTQEPQQGLADSVQCAEKFKQKQNLEELQNLEEGLQAPTPKSDYVKGIALLHSAIRGSTSGDTIGAPLAAYCLRGNLLFRMSHQTVVLPLNQALAYLENKQIFATVSQNGAIRATIYDYIFRTKSVVEFDNMNYWEFVKTQEFCKNVNPIDENSEDEQQEQNCSTFNIDKISYKIKKSKSTARIIHPFIIGHPQHGVSGHRQRTRIFLPKYTAQRLPDSAQLQDDSNLMENEIEENRNRYAQGVLVMFHPFRKLPDLVNEGETWWNAFLRLKPKLYENTSTKKTIFNIQNYYEAFYRRKEGEENCEFSTKDIEKMAREDQELEKIDENNEDIFDADYLGESSQQQVKLHPLIEKLKQLANDPLQIIPSPWPASISHAALQEAISLLPSNLDKEFKLPGRARLGIPIDKSNPNEMDDQFQVYLDKPIGELKIKTCFLN